MSEQEEVASSGAVLAGTIMYAIAVAGIFICGSYSSYPDEFAIAGFIFVFASSSILNPLLNADLARLKEKQDRIARELRAVERVPTGSSANERGGQTETHADVQKGPTGDTL